MRNGRFVLPVGDEGAQLHLYVTQLGNVQPPRVFPTPVCPIRYSRQYRSTDRVTILRLREPVDLLPDLAYDIVGDS